MELRARWEMLGDGCCLFQALVYGCEGSTSQAKVIALRSQIAKTMLEHPQMDIAGTSIAEWIWRDSGLEIKEYVTRLENGAWGGGVEMAAFARATGRSVRVYTTIGRSGLVRLIAAFGGEVASAAEGGAVWGGVEVLYEGGDHYDAVQVCGTAVGEGREGGGLSGGGGGGA